MPREHRQIYLGADELVLALNAFRRTNPDALPQGTIRTIVLLADEIVVRIEMTYGETPHVGEIRLSPERLTEPLVQYCLENNIPIPRAGQKRSLIAGKEVALEIVLD